MRQSRIFRIFVSSTFGDMKAERETLQNEVFPKLARLCEAHNCTFQAIDLRWGVSTEAALDQQTMNICLSELQRCRDLNPRPNFIVLLGDRYGWIPLPPRIEASGFEAILAQVTEGRSRLLDWYRLDTNADPPEYVLRPRRPDDPEEANPDSWTATENDLRDILIRAIDRLDLPEHDPLRIIRECSATHQEILHGALDLPDAREHVFAFFRSITNIDDLPPGSVYTDRNRNRVLRLKEQMRKPGVTVFDYPVTYDDREIRSHLGDFARDALDALMNVIDEELAELSQIDPLTQEDIDHENFAADRCRLFVGRGGVLRRIDQYINGAEPYPLVIYGPSGCGKSAVIAKSAQLALDRFRATTDLRTIQRYIGATPRSTDIRSLLANLCEELQRELSTEPQSAIPDDYAGLSRRFAELVAGLPADRESRLTILYIDALDQLNPSENARALNWLPTTLPANVRIVVSVLQSDDEAGQCLMSAFDRFPQEALFRLDDMTPDEAGQALTEWLRDAGRRLTDEQRAIVLRAFAACPTPLYLKLAFEEARRWKSYDRESRLTILSHNAPGIVRDMLARLSDSRNHGEVLVRSFLGLLAASRHGLSESEIIDLLSAEDVMSDLKARSARSPDATRLPAVVWLRLYNDLAPYLMERSADGTVLLNFYHRQVAQTVREDYLGNQQARLSAHSVLADYFSGAALFLDDDAAKPNLRKLSELPHNLYEGEMGQRLHELVKAAEFLEVTESASGPWEALQIVRKDIDLALRENRIADIQESGDRYHSMLRLSADRLSRFRTAILQGDLPLAKGIANAVGDNSLRYWLLSEGIAASLTAGDELSARDWLNDLTGTDVGELTPVFSVLVAPLLERIALLKPEWIADVGKRCHEACLCQLARRVCLKGQLKFAEQIITASGNTALSRAEFGCLLLRRGAPGPDLHELVLHSMDLRVSSINELRSNSLDYARVALDNGGDEWALTFHGPEWRADVVRLGGSDPWSSTFGQISPDPRRRLEDIRSHEAKARDWHRHFPAGAREALGALCPNYWGERWDAADGAVALEYYRSATDIEKRLLTGAWLASHMRLVGHEEDGWALAAEVALADQSAAVLGERTAQQSEQPHEAVADAAAEAREPLPQVDPRKRAEAFRTLSNSEEAVRGLVSLALQMDSEHADEAIGLIQEAQQRLPELQDASAAEKLLVSLSCEAEKACERDPAEQPTVEVLCAALELTAVGLAKINARTRSYRYFELAERIARCMWSLQLNDRKLFAQVLTMIADEAVRALPAIVGQPVLEGSVTYRDLDRVLGYGVANADRWIALDTAEREARGDGIEGLIAAQFSIQQRAEASAPMDTLGFMDQSRLIVGISRSLYKAGAAEAAGDIRRSAAKTVHAFRRDPNLSVVIQLFLAPFLIASVEADDTALAEEAVDATLSLIETGKSEDFQENTTQLFDELRGTYITDDALPCFPVDLACRLIDGLASIRERRGDEIGQHHWDKDCDQTWILEQAIHWAACMKSAELAVLWMEQVENITGDSQRLADAAFTIVADVALLDLPEQVRGLLCLIQDPHKRFERIERLAGSPVAARRGLWDYLVTETLGHKTLFDRILRHIPLSR